MAALSYLSTALLQPQCGKRAAPVALPILSRRKKIVFSLLVFTVVIALAEGAARVWLYWLAAPEQYPNYALATEFPQAAKYVPHHYLCYTLQPGYRRRGTVHNSLGYRGREIAVPKPAGVFRIAILGGSTTYTEFVYDDAKTFPAQLEQVLRTRYGHGNVEVVNAGCPGYNSWESLVNLEFRVLDLEPDLVIDYDGINDVHSRLVVPAAYKGDNSGRRTVWAPPLEVRLMQLSVLGRIIGYHLGLWHHPGVECFVRAPTADPGTHRSARVLGEDPRQILEQNPPNFFHRNLRSLIAVARANGARVMLATAAHTPACGDYAGTPHYEQGYRENNDVIRAVAREQQVPVFDFAGQMPQDRQWWRDGRHVNEAGARLQAELFAAFIHDGQLIR